MVDLLELIKNRKTIRRYEKKRIPKKIIDKIIEAGRWGPSVPSFLKIQPWIFIVMTSNVSISRIAEIILHKSRESRVGVNILLSSASRIIAGAPAIILIYNSQEVKALKNKYKEMYSNFEEIIPKAELSAISAAIQNMILTAESIGIGSCWLDTPLFCKKEIAEFTGINKELVAVLTLGYPAENGTRSSRKPVSESVRYIN